MVKFIQFDTTSEDYVRNSKIYLQNGNNTIIYWREPRCVSKKKIPACLLRPIDITHGEDIVYGGVVKNITIQSVENVFNNIAGGQAAMLGLPAGWDIDGFLYEIHKTLKNGTNYQKTSNIAAITIQVTGVGGKRKVRGNQRGRKIIL